MIYMIRIPCEICRVDDSGAMTTKQPNYVEIDVQASGPDEAAAIVAENLRALIREEENGNIPRRDWG